MKKGYDKKHLQSVKYKVGDLALVASLHLPSTRGMSKLDMKWRGPYEILSMVGPASYELKMLEVWRGHQVFHHKKLKLYIAPAFPGQTK